MPAAEAFRPDFIIVSAGFDAHQQDPLGQLEVTTAAFTEASRIVCDLADRLAGGRLVSSLEGGYDLDALAESVASTISKCCSATEALPGPSLVPPRAAGSPRPGLSTQRSSPSS